MIESEKLSRNIFNILNKTPWLKAKDLAKTLDINVKNKSFYTKFIYHLQNLCILGVLRTKYSRSSLVYIYAPIEGW